ncbi:MAG: hypothetical protein AAF725_19820 [Acidobacteriota bacterium]
MPETAAVRPNALRLKLSRAPEERLPRRQGLIRADPATVGFAGLLGLALLAAAFFALLLLLTPQTASAQAAPAAAEASLPLDEVLRLYRELDAARDSLDRDPEAQPPVDAVVDRLDLRGRVLDEALEITASVQLTVLAEERWVRLPLLRLGPRTVLGDLPESLPVALVLENGELVALAKRPEGGARQLRFEIPFLERAEAGGAPGSALTATVRTAGATLHRLTLELDEALFRLESGGLRRQGERYHLVPENGAYRVSWRRVEGRTPSAATVAERPPLEPVITAAHLSTVSTLEGEIHHRLRYDLLFEGSRELTLTLPEGARLAKVFVNGRKVPFELEGRELTVVASPERAGDRRGRIELSLRPQREEYHLSGEMRIALPAASWPVDHFYARLHLPAVFEYRWAGGSLAPAEGVPQPEFSESLPTPGDRLTFEQPLVQGSHPTVRVAYDIDLEGQIFGAP